MLINNDFVKTETNVEFVSYTGQSPCLCHGILTLIINGEQISFGHNYLGGNWRNDGNYNSFWRSGGECGFYNDYQDSYVSQSEWIIDVDDIPDQFKKYASQIDRVFNENVEYGCCGGCL